MTLTLLGRRRADVPANPWRAPTLTARGAALAAPPYAIPTTAPFNVPTPATTPTPDGTGHAVHPDVIDFGAQWRGWRFWMGMTPYHANNFREENPCVLVSNDGRTWQAPSGLVNPVAPAPTNPEQWNSDTDLTYDPVADELVLFFRDGTFSVRVTRSGDGVNWSAAMQADRTPVGSQEIVSPAVIRLPGGMWAMWGVCHPERKLYRWTAPSPRGPWRAVQQCSGVGGANIWHFDIARVGTTLYMLMHEGWTAAEGGSTAFALASSDGINWARGASPILVPSGGAAWDAGELYRGSLQPHEDGDHFRVWYCGRPTPSSSDWRIGLTHIPLAAWPTPPA